MRIRTMTPEDFDALYELWTTNDGIGTSDADDTPEGLARYLRATPRPPSWRWTTRRGARRHPLRPRWPARLHLPHGGFRRLSEAGHRWDASGGRRSRSEGRRHRRSTCPPMPATRPQRPSGAATASSERSELVFRSKALR